MNKNKKVLNKGKSYSMITISGKKDIYLINDENFVCNLDFEIIMKVKEPEN
jgi:hypothetical protein